MGKHPIRWAQAIGMNYIHLGSPAGGWSPRASRFCIRTRTVQIASEVMAAPTTTKYNPLPAIWTKVPVEKVVIAITKRMEVIMVIVSHLRAFWLMAIRSTNDSGSTVSPGGLPRGG